MGGLVQQGKPGHFEPLVIGALEDSLWCSSDPLCVESHGQGIDQSVEDRSNGARPADLRHCVARPTSAES